MPHNNLAALINYQPIIHAFHKLYSGKTPENIVYHDANVRTAIQGKGGRRYDLPASNLTGFIYEPNDRTPRIKVTLAGKDVPLELKEISTADAANLAMSLQRSNRLKEANQVITAAELDVEKTQQLAPANHATTLSLDFDQLSRLTTDHGSTRFLPKNRLFLPAIPGWPLC